MLIGKKSALPRNRLRTLSGQTITVTGEYCREAKTRPDSHLIRRIQNEEGRHLCDHLWIECKIHKPPSYGDTVIVTGEVVKYGKFSYKKQLAEDYALGSVRCSMIRKESMCLST